MKLNEIKLFKDPSDEKFTDALAHFVKERGLGFAEGGQAKVVWIEGKNWIWRAWFNDPGFERFLKYIEAHPNNPHLPKILSKVREEPVSFKRLPKDIKIKYVKIEKLRELDNSKLKTAIDVMIDYVAHIPSTIEGLADAVRSDFGSAELADEILKNKSFFETVIDLLEHDANDISGLDNILMRGTVPVISDPFKD